MVEPPNIPDEVLDSLEKQCERGGSPRAFAPLAEAYRLAGGLDAALAVAKRGLEAFPNHLGIRLVLARALMDVGDQGAAHAQYRSVLCRDPENQEAAASLGEREPDAGAATAIEKPRREHTTLSSELAHLADLFAAPSGPKDAPPDAIATLTLAEIYARQGATERAIEICEAILRRDPDDLEASARLERYRSEMASLT